MDDFLDIVRIIGMVLVGLVIAALVICLPWLIWGDTRVADIKLASQGVWQKNGYEVIGYEGYQLTLLDRPGGCVWYIVRRADTDYHGCISRWGDEYHIYNLRALNANT